MDDREQFQKAYGKIVARAWADEGFKQRLLENPRTVLKENGIDAPEGVEIRVMESTSHLIHLILPPRPDTAEMAAADLERTQTALLTPIFWCGWIRT